MAQPIVRKAYAEVRPGKQIHYRYVHPLEHSPMNLPIVYLHKSASSSASYEQLMLHYALEGHSGYAPDMPGFGGSFDQDEEDVTAIGNRNTRWYVDIFMQVFKQLGLYEAVISMNTKQASAAKPVHIIGNHSGAALATEIAAIYPDFVYSITLVGPTIMNTEERLRMRESSQVSFNKPLQDGSHLLKTWTYLKNTGIGDDIAMHQKEAIDQIRAWRGRDLVYGAIWTQDSEEILSLVQCPVLVLCSRGDVLWRYVGNVQRVKPQAKMAEIGGENFSVIRDVAGIVREWDAFRQQNEELAS